MLAKNWIRRFVLTESGTASFSRSVFWHCLKNGDSRSARWSGIAKICFRNSATLPNGGSLRRNVSATAI